MTTMTPPQVASRWGCKPETVRKLLEAGALLGFQISPPGTRRPRWRITLDAVLDYEAGAPQAAATPARTVRRRRRTLPTVAGPF